jgi:hypothetical protein
MGAVSALRLRCLVLRSSLMVCRFMMYGCVHMTGLHNLDASNRGHV